MISLQTNPLIWRDARRLLRPGTFLGWGIGTLSLIFLVLMLLAIHFYGVPHPPQHRDPDENLPRYFAYFCLGVQTLLAGFISLWISLDAVVTERRQESYVFLETLPLSPTDKVIGLGIGRNFGGGLLMLCYGVVGIIAGVVGGIDLSRLLALQAVLWTTWMAMIVIGLTFSLHSGRSPLGIVLVFLYLVIGIGLTGGILDNNFDIWPLLTLSPFASLAGSVAPLDELHTLGDRTIGFFHLQLPWQCCPVAFNLLLTGAFFHSASRGMSRPSNPLACRWSTLIVAVILHALLLGFLADSFVRTDVVSADGGTSIISRMHSRDWGEFGMAYMCIFAIMTFVWLLCHSPNARTAMEWVERPRRWRRWFLESLTEKGSPAVWPAGALMVLAIVAAMLAPRFYPTHASVSSWAMEREIGAVIPSPDAPPTHEQTMAAMDRIWHADKHALNAGMAMTASLLLVYLLACGSLAATALLGGKKVGGGWRFWLLLVPILLPLLLAAASGEESYLNLTIFGGLIEAGNVIDGSWEGQSYHDTWASYRTSLLSGLVLLAGGLALLASAYSNLYRRSPAGKAEAANQSSADAA